MRNKSELKTLNGYKFRIGVPFEVADGRLARTVSLRNYEGKRIETRTVKAHDDEMLEAQTQQMVSRLVEEYSEICIQQLRNSPSTVICLDDYVEARGNDIARSKRWAGKKKDYLDVWKNKLASRFGSFNLRTCTDSSVFEDAMEEMTHHKRQKRSWKEEECKYWFILHDILDFAVNDGLLVSNPLVDINNKCRKLASTDASKFMARRGLDFDERQRLFAESLSSEDSGVPPAIRFQLLTGLTVFELCALNTDDLVAGKYVSWIEIVKEYKQGRGKEPIMTKLLSDANAYRRVVCTDTVLDLLRDQIAGQKKLSELGQVICEPGKQADKPVIPLFTNRHGVRMQPEEYKRQVREILVRIIKDGAHLSFRERAPVLGVDTTMASTDILRGTAEHVFRVRCGMAPSEIEAIMGRYRLNTLAIYYIDWGNELKMLYTKHQLERWHSQMNDEHAYQHLLYCTVTCPKDTTLTLYAEHGYKGQVSVS